MAAALNQQRPEMDLSLYFFFLAARKNPLPPFRVSWRR